MEKNYLEIDIKLLVLKYGYGPVLKGLAMATDTSLEEIEAMIRRIAEKKSPKARTLQRKTAIETAEKIISSSPNYELLHELALRYQDKTFLPQLRDAKRFLERHGIMREVKKRSLAVGPVFEVLATQSQQELKELLADLHPAGTSTFSQLANEIIGRPSGPVKKPC
jgi:hypothetical protein